MPNILLIESATKVCSVGVLKGEEVFVKEEFNENFSHAENLTVFVEEVMKKANLTMSELNAVAVSSGPGSYTGLRIGVSLAKGICYALNIPLISVDTLQYLAQREFFEHFSADSFYVISMIDARRMEVYCNVFDEDNKALSETTNKIIEPDSFKELLDKKKVFFVGDAAEKCQSVIEHPNAVFLPDALCSANKMASIASAKFKSNKFEDTAYYVPFYLKSFVPGKSTKSFF